MRASSLLLTACLLPACASPPQPAENAYLDYSGRDDVLSGGVKMVEITTPKGDLRVWTKRIGNSPTKKGLLLHGGPGATPEHWEAVDSYFPAAEIEYYYYDQLGSYYSDQPTDPSLWETDRFVEEVERLVTEGRLPAIKRLRAIGYREIAAYLQGESSLDEAVEAM